MKKITFYLLVMSLFMTGCGFNTVSQTQRGVVFKFGKVVSIQEPGREWHGYGYSEQNINIGVRTTSYTNENSLTGDRKPVSVEISVNYKINSFSLLNKWENYGTIYSNNESLNLEVNERVAVEVRKALNRVEFWSLFDASIDASGVHGRDQLKEYLIEDLQISLETMGLLLVDVQLVDISPASNIAEEIESIAELELRKERAEQLQLVLDQEIETAEKERQLAVVQAQIYQSNPELMELEIHKLWVTAITEGHVEVIFVPTETGVPILNSTSNQSPLHTVPTN